MSTVKGSILKAKVVLLGDSGVGAKTSLVQRFVNDEFQEDTIPTIGPILSTKDLVVEDVKVKLELWGLRSHQNEETSNVVNADVSMHRHMRTRTFSYHGANGSPRCTSSNCGL